MPRRMTSSASSRALHWLIGRSDAAGCSQATAMIWQTCSGVIRAGAPGLGASASRAATRSSASGTGWNWHQRARHWRAVPTSTPSVRATALVLSPAAASSTIRARSASCCPVVCARASRSSAARSSPLSTISGAFGPGMTISTYPTKMAHPTRPSTICGRSCAPHY